MTIYRKSQPLRKGQRDGKIPLPNKIEFLDLYEIQNKSRKDLSLHYGVHKGTIDNWCKIFGAQKTKQQQIEIALKNTKFHTNRTGQYSENTFIKFPELKHKDGIFYVVRMFSETESFFKIGITTSSTKLRYRGRLRHYSYEILHEQKMNLYDAYTLEQQYKQSHKSHRYIPQIKFGGHTECYISQPPAEQLNICTPSV